MQTVRDLYEVLGVPRDASEDDIKRAYRRQARSLHPDSGGDEEAFKQLTAAYEVLRNPDARANYDRFGDPRGPGGGMGGDPFAGFGDLSDLIGDFFGAFGGTGARTRAASNAGRDAVVDVTITLEEAAAGVTRDIDATILRACDTCDGTGGRDGAAPVTCPTCRGQGAVQRVRQSVFGQMLSTSACPDCRGRGRQVSDPCPDCRGEGRRQTQETLSIPIPAGIDPDRRLRLAGKGEAGAQGGSSGDLYVRVRVRPHEVFTRDGDDLHCELRVGMVPAALGTALVLPTLDGEEEIEVPAGTQSGDVLTVRRKGMPRLGGGGVQRGDLHVHCRVLTPTDLTDEQADLLRRLGDLRGEDATGPGVHRGGFFGRLRDAFGA